MQRLLRLIRSQIRYKIILPYLLLMLIVTLAGAGIALALTAASWQERLTEQLKQIGRSTSTALLQRERDHLAFLYLVALSQSNDEIGALSMPDAFASNDPQQVIKALEPYYAYQQQFKDTLDVDRMIAFDRTGKAYVDWLRTADDQPPASIPGTDLSSVADIQRVLRSSQNDNVDKYANLIQFLPDPQAHFYTVVPVYKDNEVVGGVLIGIKIDRMLRQFERTSQSVVTNVYSNDGTALGSSLLSRENELPTSGMTPAVLDQLRNSTEGTVFNTVQIRGNNYEYAYSPLVIAETQVGYYSVAISRDFQAESLSLSRNAVMAIALALALGAVAVGYWVARNITLPLGELVDTAQAVAGGDLERRTEFTSQDELGTLAMSFNQMTEHLLRLYNTSRDLSTKIDIHDVLDVANTTARSLVPEVDAFALLDERGTWVYILPQSSPESLVQIGDVQLSTAHPMLNELARERSQMLVTADSPLLAGDALVHIAGYQELLLTPLLIRDSLVGVLLFGHRQVGQFTPSVMPTLTATANMAASVLYNALLYSQVAEEANERKAILQSIADGVVVVDASGDIMLANEAAQHMLNMPLAQLLRRNFETLSLERAQQRQDLFGEGHAGIEHYRLNDRAVTLSRAPVVGEHDEQLGEVIVLHDITTEVAVDEAKTDFIATISHELRTPLTPIYSYIELLQRGVYGQLNDDQREVLAVIHGRAEQLKDLINNIVLVASIQSNTLATVIEPLNLGAVVETAASPLQRAMEKKNLQFEVHISNDLPDVLADREQLRIILNQLLDNARRYTSSGSITVRAKPVDSTIQVDITDTGSGIPADRLNRLFTRFQRIDGNSSQERGSGLGLAIARQLAERLGGHIWARSELGQGSTFSFSLPIADGQIDATANDPEVKNTTA